MSETPQPRNTFERVLAQRTDSDVARQAARVVELAQQRLSGRVPGRWRAARNALLVALALVALVMVLSGGSRVRRGNEPIGAAAVATAEGAGVGSSASGFLPQPVHGTAPSPGPTPTPAPTPAPSVAPAAPARAAGAAERRPRRASSGEDQRDVLFTAADAPADYAVEIGVPGAMRDGTGAEPAAAGPVLNIGTRLRVALEAPLRTGAALVPATALLAEDVRVGGTVALPLGTRLVGSAFATPQDDRVQIVWRALIHAGRTVALEGETLGADGAPGITGTVLDRRRKGVLRRVGSAVLGTAGEVAGVAVPYGDSLLDRTGATLAGRAGRELGQLGGGREWLQADTVVELKPGTACVVFLLADLALPGAAK